VICLFSVTALGIFLATLTRAMPQFGLLAIPVFMVMNLLSGGTTPLDSMPELLQALMQLSPSTHFVSFAQAILYRDAGFAVVWPYFAAVAASGAVFFRRRPVAVSPDGDVDAELSLECATLCATAQTPR
jgi:ABC-2 type transport system permease protein